MKRISITALLFTLTASFTACKEGKENTATGSAASATAAATGAVNKPAKTITINEADWTVRNLKEVSPLVNISMKVPKDAKLEQNANGGVDIPVNNLYMLTVSTLAVSDIAEAMASDKAIALGGLYTNARVVTEEPTGMIYTRQLQDEHVKHQPEFHFAAYLEKDGAIYSIQDQQPLDAPFDTPGSTYSEALAKQVYGIVKSSAKIN